MQPHNTKKTGVLLLHRPRIFLRQHVSPRGIMHWRNNKSFAVGVVSFISGCIFTLMFCSFNNELKSESGMQQVAQKMSDKLDQQSLVDSDPVADNGSGANDLPAPDTAVHEPPKPTLPQYPPELKGKAMFLSPSGYNEDAFLIIIVVSSGRNFEARKAIRSSWGNTNSNSNSTGESFQVIFVVGCDEVNDERVEKEAKMHGDILRGHFLDTYVQNEQHTVKTLLGLKWAISMSNPQYLLKVNSESFVNIRETITWLRSLGEGTGPNDNYRREFYAGYCHMGVKVVRNVQSPYFIPESQWSEDLLPAYSSGIGVVLSQDISKKMVRYARQVKLILFLFKRHKGLQ